MLLVADADPQNCDVVLRRVASYCPDDLVQKLVEGKLVIPPEGVGESGYAVLAWLSSSFDEAVGVEN